MKTFWAGERSGEGGGDFRGSGTPIAEDKVARGDSGGTIQGSGVTLSDADALSGITRLDVDNVRIDGNTILSTNANGQILLDPDGTGAVQVASGLLQLGGSSSSFTGLKSDSGGYAGFLASRLADDSGYAAIVATVGAFMWAAAQHLRADPGALGGTGAFIARAAGGFAWTGGAEANSGIDTSILRAAAGVQLDSDGSAGLGGRLSGLVLEASTAGSGAPNVLLTTESGKLLTNTGAGAEAYNTLPTVSGSISPYFLFNCEVAAGIRATAPSGVTIRLGNSTSAAGGFVRSIAPGSCLTLAWNGTRWVGVAITGTWTVDV